MIYTYIHVYIYIQISIYIYIYVDVCVCVCVCVCACIPQLAIPMTVGRWWSNKRMESLGKRPPIWPKTLPWWPNPWMTLTPDISWPVATDWQTSYSSNHSCLSMAEDSAWPSNSWQRAMAESDKASRSGQSCLSNLDMEWRCNPVQCEALAPQPQRLQVHEGKLMRKTWNPLGTQCKCRSFFPFSNVPKLCPWLALHRTRRFWNPKSGKP